MGFHSPAKTQNPFFRSFGAALVLVLALMVCAPALSQQPTEGQNGLPLPRFASTRSTPINVRVGPGEKYNIAWIYVKAGVPVEIVAEFDTWRKIRDFDGQEGWIHQSLLVGTRVAYVAPWAKDQSTPLHSQPDDDAGVRAYLGSNYRVNVDRCDGKWCEVNAVDNPTNGRPATYTGWLHQTDLWGVYATETIK